MRCPEKAKRSIIYHRELKEKVEEIITGKLLRSTKINSEVIILSNWKEKLREPRNLERKRKKGEKRWDLIHLNNSKKKLYS